MNTDLIDEFLERARPESLRYLFEIVRIPELWDRLIRGRTGGVCINLKENGSFITRAAPQSSLRGISFETLDSFFRNQWYKDFVLISEFKSQVFIESPDYIIFPVLSEQQFYGQFILKLNLEHLESDYFKSKCVPDFIEAKRVLIE